MFDVARFWLDLGVDGFRVDAAHQMMKDPRERDNPPAPEDYTRPWKDMGDYDRFIHLYDFAHPDVHEAHREFRAVLDSYPHDPVSVGEIHIFDLPEWAAYYGEHLDQIHMPFNFHLMVAPWEASTHQGSHRDRPLACSRRGLDQLAAGQSRRDKDQRPVWAR